MKDRMTQGFRADAAETAALTLPDLRADQRIFDALDWEHDERRRDAEVRRRRNTVVQRVRRALGNDCANLTYAYLKGKSWREIGIPRSTFFHRLKKVKIFLKA